MFHTHHSNQLEVLADRLTDLLREPLPSPLAREIVVVQSNGMARWLALRLADRLGVCANLSFQFPATFLWEMARAVLRHLPPTSSFDKPVLNWRIMALLREVDQSPRFAPVRAWLGDERDDFRRHELACRIADCLDQYLVYRPDWIQQWEAGGEDHWQAELWRRLAQDGEAHRHGRLGVGRDIDGCARIHDDDPAVPRRQHGPQVEQAAADDDGVVFRLGLRRTPRRLPAGLAGQPFLEQRQCRIASGHARLLCPSARCRNASEAL